MTYSKNPFVLKSFGGVPVLFWLAGLCYLIPFIAYGINFYCFNVSKDTGSWGEFGDFVGGVVNPTIGLMTVWFLAFTLKQSDATHNEQINHSQKTKDFEVCMSLISFYKNSGDQKTKSAIEKRDSINVLQRGDADRLFAEAKQFFDLANELMPILTKEHLHLREKYLT